MAVKLEGSGQKGCGKDAPTIESTGEGKGAGERPPTDTFVFDDIRWTSHTRSRAQLDCMRELPCRADDVFVASYPKCGTHWVHKLCQLILKNNCFMYPMEFNHWEKGSFWPGKGSGKGDLKHAEVPAPHIMATHLPVKWLPKDAEKKGSCIVYVVREPKDTLVSYWHFANANEWIQNEPDLEVFLQQFVAGAKTDVAEATAAGAMIGGYAAHVHGYVEAAKAGRRIHFMSYDRLHTSPKEEIQSLAEYLCAPLSDEEMALVHGQSGFAAMKAETRAKEDAKGKGKGSEDELWSNVLWRKGEQGDGATTMTSDQAARVDIAFGNAFKPVEYVFGPTREALFKALGA